MAGKLDREIDRCARSDRVGEHAFDDAVFQRLVGQHHDASAEGERVQSSRKCTAQ